MNYFKTATLLAALTTLFGVIGFVIGDVKGAAWALGIATAINFYTWFCSGESIIRQLRARAVDMQSEPDLVSLVHDLAAAAGLPPPRVYVSDEEQPNSFAVGCSPMHAAIIVTQGAVDILTPQEVAGVIAHELAHIRARDSLTMTVSATLAGAILAIASVFAVMGLAMRRQGGAVMIALAIIAPIAGLILQMAIGHSREYASDAGGAAICGHPEWLICALRKLADAAKEIPNSNVLTCPQTAPLFFVDPLPDNWFAKLFDTHPPIDKRIARLHAIIERQAS
jgi:heat shock protein HtpX